MATSASAAVVQVAPSSSCRQGLRQMKSRKWRIYNHLTACHRFGGGPYEREKHSSSATEYSYRFNMPGLDRPNAPRRLPSSVFADPQFRRSIADTPVQSPYSADSSLSQISPKTLTLSRRTFSNSSPSHLRQQSSSSGSNGTGSAEPAGSVSPLAINRRRQPSSNPSQLRQGSHSCDTELHPSSNRPESGFGLAFLDIIAPGLRREPQRATGQQSEGPSTAESSSPNSTRSSISTKAKKLLNIPPLRIANNATKDGGPPRDAKRGFHWQKEISGHWLEIRIGKRQSSSQGDPGPVHHPTLAPTQATRMPPAMPPAAKVSSRSSASNGSSGGSHEGPLRWLARQAGASPAALPAHESLTAKTMRRIGIKHGASENPLNRHNMRTDTGDRLDKTASLLNVIAAKQSQDLSLQSKSSVASSQRSQNSVASSVPKWQRILTDNILSTEIASTESSASGSTIPTHLRPPQTTPNPAEMYTGTDNKQYFRVMMTDPDGPNFLPSEARRVNTPPISHHGRNRGFFFDHKPPDLVDKIPKSFQARPPPQLRTQSSESTETGNSGEGRAGRTRRVSMTEWYTVQLNAIEQDYERTRFVNEVPDHLANSPLCPLHPKNVSGELSCPLHGERKVAGFEEREKGVEGYRGSEVHAIEY